MHSLAMLARYEEQRRNKLTPEELEKVQLMNGRRVALQSKILLLSAFISVAAFHLHLVAGMIAVALGFYNSTMIPILILYFKESVGFRAGIRHIVLGNIFLGGVILMLLNFIQLNAPL
jgi:hypothetical protein